MEAGVDSLAASEFVQQLAAEFGVELPATLLFDHPSMSSIASHVADELSSASSMTLAVELTSTAKCIHTQSEYEEPPVELGLAVDGVAVVSYN